MLMSSCRKVIVWYRAYSYLWNTAWLVRVECLEATLKIIAVVAFIGIKITPLAPAGGWPLTQPNYPFWVEKILALLNIIRKFKKTAVSGRFSIKIQQVYLSHMYDY